MLKTALGSIELLDEPPGVLNRRLTTFAFSKKGNHATVKIIGCFQIEPVVESFKFVRGTIRVGGKNFTVYDRHAMDGMPAKEITEETCIVLLDEDRSLCQEGTAIIVNNTTELLSFIDEQLKL